MKLNHLLASAAVAAVVIGTAPAHAQIRGAGARGGAIGMQRATLGGSFGAVHSTASERAAASASSHGEARVDRTHRADKLANGLAHERVRDADHANVEAQSTSHRAAEAGASDAAGVGQAEKAAARNAATYTGATAAEQGTERAGAMNSRGGFADGVTGREALATKPETNAHSVPPDRQTAPTKQSDTSSETLRRPPAKGAGSSSESGASASASSSTSVEASAKP